MAVVNNRNRDIIRTYLGPPEDPAATSVVEIQNLGSYPTGSSGAGLVSGQVTDTASVRLLAGSPGVIWKANTLHLALYTGTTNMSVGSIVQIIDGDFVAATGVLTFTGIAVAGTTITIGTRVYTWRAAPALVDEITIGDDQAASEANLTTAINTGPQGGGTANAQVTAVDGAGTVTLTAIATGAAGNSIATTTTMASASFGDTTLTGGVTPNDVASFTLWPGMEIANRLYDCFMFFDPPIKTTAGNGLYLVASQAFGTGGMCAVSGTAWGFSS